MSTGTLAKRYARAVYELAEEANDVERVGRDLADLAATWEASEELQELFKNPSFASDARKAVLTEIANRAQLCDTVKHTLFYLSDRGRLSALPEVVERFTQIAEEKAGGVRAEVTTAAPMPDAYYDALQKALEQSTGKKVRLEKKTDPSLIAGVVTRVGDHVFDGSVKNRLAGLKESLGAS